MALYEHTVPVLDSLRAASLQNALPQGEGQRTKKSRILQAAKKSVKTGWFDLHRGFLYRCERGKWMYSFVAKRLLRRTSSQV